MGDYKGEEGDIVDIQTMSFMTIFISWDINSLRFRTRGRTI